MVIAAARAPASNLPADLTTFVGRRREIVDGRRLLAASRLVTLTGVGGVGKTRLALRIAADSRRAFPDGVHLVELGELQDPALLPHTVAERLGVVDQSTRWAVTTLSEYLEDKHLLLLLDNCEHLVAACAELTDTLLRSCPQIHILATSREPLGIHGEATLTVPPLSVPEAGEGRSPDILLLYDAVALFADRATAALPGFSLDAQVGDTIVRLCRHLDGIPLAIELSAAWLRALSLDQLEQRVADRFLFLSKGSRVAPLRQQTLRSLVDWSYDLCTTEERLLWARLSVFAGGFELEAAEESVRRRLGGRGYDAAHLRGYQLTEADAFAAALEETTGTSTAPESSDRAAPTTLTKRERQIAEFVARGLTNKEIAARLVIAQRTVDGHVEHILSKLGFNSRTQVAVWFTEQAAGPRRPG